MHLRCLPQVWDERHEEVPLQPSLVEVLRRPVGGRYQHHVVLDHVLEKPLQDQCVRDVGYLKLVQTEQPHVLRAARGDLEDRVFLGRALVHVAMDFEHKLVEMHTLLLGDLNALVEEVHQEGFAGAWRAEDIEAGHRADLRAVGGLGGRGHDPLGGGDHGLRSAKDGAEEAERLLLLEGLGRGGG